MDEERGNGREALCCRRAEEVCLQTVRRWTARWCAPSLLYGRMHHDGWKGWKRPF